MMAIRTLGHWHSPLPWVVHGDDRQRITIPSDPLVQIARTFVGSGVMPLETACANATLIVTAVNAHADLLAALKGAFCYWCDMRYGGEADPCSERSAVRALIAKAEGR